MGWLEIRDTGVGVLDILEAISQGLGIEQILVRFPGLFAGDIADSAAIARLIIIGHAPPENRPASAISRKDRFSGVRRKTGPWSKDEEIELMKLVNSGASMDDVARILMRMRSDVGRKFDTFSNH